MVDVLDETNSLEPGTMVVELTMDNQSWDYEPYPIQLVVEHSLHFADLMFGNMITEIGYSS